MGDDILTATDAEFETQVLRSEKPVLVDFWADWCVPCHMVSPVVEELGTELNQTMTVAKLNVDDNPGTAQRFGVMSIPTLILFKAGEEVARVVGAQPKERIWEQIQPHVAA